MIARTVKQQLQWENRHMREMLTAFIAASKERESASKRYRYHLSRGTASSYLTSRVIGAAIALNQCVKAAQAFLSPTLQPSYDYPVPNENWDHGNPINGVKDIGEVLRIQKLNPTIPPEIIRGLVQHGVHREAVQQANPKSWDKHSIALWISRCHGCLTSSRWEVSYMFGDLS